MFLTYIKNTLVEGDGFEPSKQDATDLQSAPFGHSGTPPNGAGDGTRTYNLLITNQLLYRWATLAHLVVINYYIFKYFRGWCRGAESNHRHKDFQSFALPTELPRQNWRFGWGSNPRPLAWQASVLTNWTTEPYLIILPKQMLVGLQGLEPRTNRLWAGCSNQLS